MNIGGYPDFRGYVKIGTHQTGEKPENHRLKHSSGVGMKKFSQEGDIKTYLEMGCS